MFHLYYFFEKPLNSKKTFNVEYHGLKSKEKMCYKDMQIHVSAISKVIPSENKYSVVGCIIGPSVYVPAILVGITKTSSFAILDTVDPVDSLRVLQSYVPVKTLLVEKCFLSNVRRDLCSCWIDTDETLCDSSVTVFNATKCQDSFCHNFVESRLQVGLAYVMKTSGTTGQSKVVQVPHQCIISNIYDLRRRFEVSSDDVVLLCSPLTFDPSIVDIFIALSTGATLVIVDSKLKSIPKAILNIIVENKITFLQATPSFIGRFGDSCIRDVLLSKDSPLRVLAFGGEVCPPLSKLRRWKGEGNNTQLYNLYGLTEVSCWTSCHKIDFSSESQLGIPLGECLWETSIDVNESGELLVGGETRQCMVNDEKWISSGGRWRETGDIVTRDSDGALYFLRRKDDVVKYNGQKLSMQTISGVVGNLEVVGSHALYFEHASSKLFVFVVPNQELSRDSFLKDLRTSIHNLPPTELIIVPYIPLTAHGKTDYRKLIEFASSRSNSKGGLHDDSYIGIILNLWKEYTAQDHAYAGDNFVLKGGDSFTALQFLSDVEWKLQTTIPALLDVLLNASIEDVLHTVKCHLYGGGGDSSVEEEPKTISNHNHHISCFPVRQCHSVVSRRGCHFECRCGGKHGTGGDDSPLKEPIEVLFKLDLKKCVDSSPCVAHYFPSDAEYVFIGSHAGIFCCACASSGVPKWTLNLPDRIESSACVSACGSCVLVGCYDHFLYCIQIENGDIRWKFETGAEIKSSPAVSSKNVVIFGSHDKHVYAVDVNNGNLVWKRVIAKGSIFSSPSISEELGLVAAASLDGVLAIFDLVTGVPFWIYDHEKPIFSSPLFHEKNLFIGSTDKKILKFESSKSFFSVSEFCTQGPVFSSASIQSDHILFGCHDSTVYCLSHSLECVWRYECTSTVFSTPFAFRRAGQEYVAVAETSGVLHILEMGSGVLKCRFQFPGEVFSSPVVVGNRLFVGCRDNHLYCLAL